MIYQTDKDFTLNCQGSLLHVHKFILISNSEFFQSFFLSMNKDDKECALEFPLEYMQYIVNYMYLGPKGIESLSPEIQSMIMPYADYLILTNKQLCDFIFE